MPTITADIAKRINRVPAEFHAALLNQAEKFYRGLNKPMFIKGWLNRLEKNPFKTELVQVQSASIGPLLLGTAIVGALVYFLRK